MIDEETFDQFFSQGLVTEVIRPIRGGKEASVYLCAAGPAGRELAALKVYHPRDHRAFRNDAVYKDGRAIVNTRDRRAVAHKTRFGRVLDESLWMHREYETLERLHAAGGDVPEPIAFWGRAILMSYVGTEEDPAPQLRQVSLAPDEAREIFDRLLWNVELFLACDVVHADLSPFNVLFCQGRATIIDFPQSVDPRTNSNASELLERDVTNLCRFFSRFGLNRDPQKLAESLWVSFLFAEL